MDGGEINPDTIYENIKSGFTRAYTKVYRDARHQRIACQYLRDGLELPSKAPWKEKLALKQYKAARLAHFWHSVAEDEEEDPDPELGAESDDDDDWEDDLDDLNLEMSYISSADERTRSELDDSGSDEWETESEAEETEPEAADNEAHGHGMALGTE